MKSWKPEMFVENRWQGNQLVFATEREAREYAEDLFLNWKLTTNYRAVESERWPNYRYINGQLLPIINDNGRPARATDNHDYD